MWEVDGPIPPPNNVRKKIVRVSWINQEQFIILSERPKSVLTHWKGGRSQKCTMQDGGCDVCLAGTKVDWRFYLYVVSGPGHTPIFLDVTQDAVNQIKTFTMDRDHLRGSILQIHKTKGGKQGRFIINVLERRIDPDKLPPEESVLPVLDYLWKCKRDD